MLSNKEVAERFAEGYSEGNSGNMFIEGNILYSYGHHFPLAVRLGRVAILNIEPYSHTTAIHRSHARSALLGQGFQIYEVGDTEEVKKISETLKGKWIKDVNELKKKILAEVL